MVNSQPVRSEQIGGLAESGEREQRQTHVGEMALLAAYFSECTGDGIDGDVAFGVVDELDDERVGLLDCG